MDNVSNNINNIPPSFVKQRIRQVNSETPILWTNLVKEPQEITLRIAARNNLMLDQAIENQNKILENQEKIMKKLDIQG